ncbi:MAG: OmpA family protein [bacterium]
MMMKGRRLSFIIGLIFMVLFLSRVGGEAQVQTDEAVREAREKVEAIKKKSQETINEIEKELARLKDEMALAERNLIEEKEKRENLEKGGLSRIKGGRIEELRQELFSQRDKADQADRARKEAEEEVNKLRGELSRLQAELKAAQGAMANQEKMQGELSAARAKLEAAQQTIADQEKESKLLLKEKEEILKAREEMQRGLSMAENAKTDLAAAEKRLETLQAELTQTKRDLALAQQKSESEALQSELAQAKGELVSARQKIEAETQKNEEIVAEINKLREEIFLAHAKTQEAVAAKEKAEKRIEELAAALNQYKAQLSIPEAAEVYQPKPTKPEPAEKQAKAPTGEKRDEKEKMPVVEITEKERSPKPKLEPAEEVIGKEKKAGPANLEEALKNLRDKEVEVIKEDSKLVMVLPIPFPRLRITVEPEYFDILDAVAQAIKLHPQLKKVIIEGHTEADEESSLLNLQLSEARADNVMKYLIEKGNVSPRLLSIRGYGGNEPLVSNKTEEGRRRNRRVEVVIMTSE